MKRYVTLTAGWTLVALGAVLLVLPGPGLPVLVGGFALLGRESEWARRVQRTISQRIQGLRTRAAGPVGVRNVGGGD